jgi:hypothetical protein
MGLENGIRDLEKTYSGSRFQESKRDQILDLGSKSATLKYYKILNFKQNFYHLKYCRKDPDKQQWAKHWGGGGATNSRTMPQIPAVNFKTEIF